MTTNTNDKVPLNQIYRIKKTFEDYPEIKKTYDDITNVSVKSLFYRYNEHGQRVVKGRRYDDAVLFNSNVDFNGKIVCELGARDGIFGAWLTQFVDKIYISDYFEEWGKGTKDDLGQMEEWTDIWNRAAPNPERMVIERQNMISLPYDDNTFDIVVSTSVIEHLYPQHQYRGDTLAVQEMARICKPGGIILLSTDMCTERESKYIGGTLYYSEKDLFERLIHPSGCKLRGEYDFKFGHPDNDAEDKHGDYGPVCSIVFSLEKPKE